MAARFEVHAPKECCSWSGDGRSNDVNSTSKRYYFYLQLFTWEDGSGMFPEWHRISPHSFTFYWKNSLVKKLYTRGLALVGRRERGGIIPNVSCFNALKLVLLKSFSAIVVNYS